MNEVEKLRKEVDIIDKKIIELVAERTDVVYTISRVKGRMNIPTPDAKREEVVIKQVRELAVANNIEEDFAEELFRKIIAYCREIQKIKQ
ncbi:MAG: chorismate mutase [Patescibacteria group bacterium]|jgi:chorismate mutase